MKMAQLRSLAKGLGVNAGRLKKPELIRSMQIAEGNFDCFGKAESDCDQTDCNFRGDCVG